MSSDERDGSLSDWLGRFGISWPVRREPLWSQSLPARTEATHPTRALRRFVEIVRAVEHPTLLDLGPVSGRTVAFLGSELGCRLVVGDLYAQLDAAARAGASLADAITAGLGTLEAGAFHGVFCWDLCDYLQWPDAGAMGRALARVLAPGAPALAMFSTVRYDAAEWTRFGIEDLDHLSARPVPSALGQHHVWLSRDVSRIYAPLRVDETYLLSHGCREVLLRKSRD